MLNDTTTWDDDERKHKCQKTHGGQLFSGVITVVNSQSQTVNVDFEDGDESVVMPFILVKEMACVITHVFRKDGKDKNVGSPSLDGCK